MHPLSYLHKRVHLSATATGRKMFARVASMTPARFDILHVLYSSRLPSRGLELIPVPQVALRNQLGLARQTVWKAVVRLVELGFVEKRIERRRVTLFLTEEGIARIRRAYGAAFTDRFALPPELAGLDDVPSKIYKPVRDAAHRQLKSLRAKYTRTTWRRSWRQHAAEMPAKVGREVGRTFTTFARQFIGTDPGWRDRLLEKLDSMIYANIELARAFGDTSELIYTLGYEDDH